MDTKYRSHEQLDAKSYHGELTHDLELVVKGDSCLMSETDGRFEAE